MQFGLHVEVIKSGPPLEEIDVHCYMPKKKIKPEGEGRACDTGRVFLKTEVSID